MKQEASVGQVVLQISSLKEVERSATIFDEAGASGGQVVP
jgi:hypothetical protein